MEVKRKATIYLASGEGRVSLTPDGEAATSKVRSERTGGAYSLFEVEILPGGGSSSHIQHREDECVYVLEGRFEFLEDEFIEDAGRVEVEVGDVVYVPKGCLHAYRNIGKGIGKLLTIHTPGGPYEEFFEEIDADLPESGRLAEIAASHGIEVIPPADGEGRNSGHPSGRLSLSDGTRPDIEFS